MLLDRARRSIIESRRVTARDAIAAKFSIFDFVKEKGLKVSVHNSISCPFHGNDEDPSLGITQDGKQFHCFGCDAKGGYIRFREYWSDKVDNTPIGYNQTIELILKENPSLCQELGFSTIYSDIVSDIEIEYDDDGRLILPEFRNRITERVSTRTLKTLFDSLLLEPDIQDFIAMVQHGHSEEYLLSMWSDNTISSISRDEAIAELTELFNMENCYGSKDGETHKE